ncbi:FecR family protein [Sphingomonas crusticola]|uniref:FecR family protein n=1 Tax=Sphingomonas crusticola TaxID=1697973 RepID=UPI000E24585F|nr:FecR domain-containing protein [Sphingomonas crusticola]
MTRERATDIEAEAARWVMRLDRSGRTPELEQEVEAWLAADSRRRGAFLQAEAAWARLDPDLSAPELVAPNPTAGIAARPSRRWLLGAGSAALAASLAGGFLLPRRGDRYRTRLGEIRHVPLDDGSVATINTGSDIDVALEKVTRRVRLVRGEAWFQVAKDRDRPFLVEAGPIRVRAVGTAFSVRRRDNGADVLVTEGAVEAWVNGAEGHRVRLTAGQRAFVADNASITEKQQAPSEVDRALAWRGGKIDLAGESLRAAASEFNRYNQRKIVIDDPALSQEGFYGIFRVDDPVGFATAVQRSFNTPVLLDDPGLIRIGHAAG